jgi:hypothetical protein
MVLFVLNKWEEKMKAPTFFTVLIVSAILLTACNMPLKAIEPAPEPTFTSIPPTLMPTNAPLPTITPIPEIVHVVWPGSPLGNINQTVHDQIDKTTAPQKQAFGGDDFRNGKYERPFDQDMNYMPFVDLVTVMLNRADPLWIYVTFKVNSALTNDTEGKTHFLVELDKDLDSRGDYLIVTGIPKTKEWSTESVMVLSNPDVNVGGTLVIMPDPSLSEGRGYYQEIFNNGKGDDPDLAMSRLSKNDTDTIILAFKNTLVGGEKGRFIWLPWTDYGVQDWSQFDFNDHYTFSQAGYPVKDDMQNYPLKALWGVDNTCRVASGFEPKGTIPGMCPEYTPLEPESPSGGCHWVCHGIAHGAAMACECM